jgi:ribosomal protein L7/L12
MMDPAMETIRTLLDRLDDKTRELVKKEQHIGDLFERIDKQADELHAVARVPYFANSEQARDLINALANKEKINAIKAYRALTGEGLKESKDQIERII